MNPLRLKVVEIVGLNLGSYGTTCKRHPECGRSIKVGDKVIFRQEVIPISKEVDVMKDVEQSTVPEGLKKGRKKKQSNDRLFFFVNLPSYAIQSIFFESNSSTNLRLRAIATKFALTGKLFSLLVMQ